MSSENKYCANEHGEIKFCNNQNCSSPHFRTAYIAYLAFQSAMENIFGYKNKLQEKVLKLR